MDTNMVSEIASTPCRDGRSDLPCESLARKSVVAFDPDQRLSVQDQQNGIMAHQRSRETMPKYQTNTIQTLRNEHSTMEYLLDKLEQQIALFEKTEQPDYDFIIEVLDYFLIYPDLCHHPKEDLILRKLQARDPEAAESVPNLEIEHEKSSERLGKFSKAVTNILLEAEIPRQAFIDIANQFIQGERAHMSMEENEFFPVALHCLSEKDWAEIDDKIDRFRDTLAADGKLRFGPLYKSISAHQHFQAS